MRSRLDRRPTKRKTPRLVLTQGNVAVALVAAVITVALLGLGLRQTEQGRSSVRGTSDIVTAGAPQDTFRSPGAIPSPNPATSPTGPTGTSTGTNANASTASGLPSAGLLPGATTIAMPGAHPLLSDVAARGGPAQVVVSWRLTGASTNRIRATITPGSGGRSTSSCRPTATGCTFSGLVNGVEYAVNLSVSKAGHVVARQKLHATPYPAVLASRTTRLWYNAADGANLITQGGSLSPGTAVRYLRDQSVWHADAGVGSYDAPMVAMINGRTALKIGVNGGMTFPASSLPVGSAPSTVYAVAAQDSPTAGADCFSHVIVWGRQSTTHMRALLKGCQNTLAFADTFDTYKQQSPTLGWRTGQTQIARADFAATHVSVWMDGVLSYTWNLPSGSQLNTGYQPTGTFGASPRTGWGWRGRLAEVIVLSAVPTKSQDATIMHYLQRKWGLHGRERG